MKTRIQISNYLCLEASFVCLLHLPDTMDILDCMTDFSPQLLLIKHNLGRRDEMKETAI